jgi:hypothetical protein
LIVDPTTDDDFALCVAVQNRHPDVVKVVIRCPNVSPAADRNFSIKVQRNNNIHKRGKIGKCSSSNTES